MARLKKGYYQGKDGKWVVVDADAIKENGRQFTFKRVGIGTEEKAKETYLEHCIEQRRTLLKIDYRTKGISLIKLYDGFDITLASSYVKPSIKQYLPSRINTVIEIFGRDYYLNFLELEEEKKWLEDELYKKLNTKSKYKNASKAINQIINCLCITSILPERIFKISTKFNHQGTSYQHNNTVQKVSRVTVEEKGKVNEHLLNEVFCRQEYSQKSLAAAYYLCTNVKKFKWSYISNIQVKNWDSPVLFVESIKNQMLYPFDLDDFKSVIEEIIIGKKKDAFIFSQDPDGSKPLKYSLIYHFRKAVTYRLFRRRISLSAFSDSIEV